MNVRRLYIYILIAAALVTADDAVLWPEQRDTSSHFRSFSLSVYYTARAEDSLRLSECAFSISAPRHLQAQTLPDARFYLRRDNVLYTLSTYRCSRDAYDNIRKIIRRQIAHAQSSSSIYHSPRSSCIIIHIISARLQRSFRFRSRLTLALSLSRTQTGTTGEDRICPREDIP